MLTFFLPISTAIIVCVLPVFFLHKEFHALAGEPHRNETHHQTYAPFGSIDNSITIDTKVVAIINRNEYEFQPKRYVSIDPDAWIIKRADGTGKLYSLASLDGSERVYVDREVLPRRTYHYIIVGVGANPAYEKKHVRGIVPHNLVVEGTVKAEKLGKMNRRHLDPGARVIYNTKGITSMSTRSFLMVLPVRLAHLKHHLSIAACANPQHFSRALDLVVGTGRNSESWVIRSQPKCLGLILTIMPGKK